MRRRVSPIIALGALVLVLVVAFVGYQLLGAQRVERKAEEPSKNEQPVEQPETGGSPEEPADQPSEEQGPLLASYDARVYTRGGDPVMLTELADGKPLVINFWATWCPYCIEELPDFQSICNDYEGRVVFAFIDATDGSRETVSGATAWLEENGFDELPVFFDNDYDAVMTLGVRAFPTTLVVSADGEIVALGSGMIDPDGMRALLDELV